MMSFDPPNDETPECELCGAHFDGRGGSVCKTCCDREQRALDVLEAVKDTRASAIKLRSIADSIGIAVKEADWDYVSVLIDQLRQHEQVVLSNSEYLAEAAKLVNAPVGRGKS